MEWFEINLCLDTDIKKQLIDISLYSEKYYKHNSTKSKYSTNLEFLITDDIYPIIPSLLSKFKIKPRRVSIVRILPNKLVDWHTDSPTFKRSTVIIFPLLPILSKYAACETESGPIEPKNCYAFNTNILHRVKNNDNTRLNLQLFFEEDIVTIFEIYKRNDLITI